MLSMHCCQRCVFSVALSLEATSAFEERLLHDISAVSLRDREPLLGGGQLTGRRQQPTVGMLRACLTLLQVLLVVPRLFLFGHEFLHSP